MAHPIAYTPLEDIPKVRVQCSDLYRLPTMSAPDPYRTAEYFQDRQDEADCISQRATCETGVYDKGS